MLPLAARRHRPRRWAWLGLAIVVAVAALGPVPAGAQYPEQRQLERARERLSEISAEIKTAEREADEADQALADADARLREVEEVVNEVATAVDRQRLVVDQARRRLEQVETEAAAVERAFADRAAHMFKQGPNLPFEVVLGAGDAQDAVARSGYLRAITQADQVTLEALEASRAAVDAERIRFEEEQERLEAMLAEQKELLEEVARIRESRAMAAAEAREQVRLLEEEHDDLEDEQARLEELIRERQEEERRRREAEERARREAEERARREAQRARKAASSRTSSSGYAWPVCGRVSSEFGQRWGRLHAGIDVAAPTGRPIGASKAGTVLHAGWRGGYGRLVLIDHHDGVVTAYAHLSSFAVGAGASVGQGQTIGAVGSTGNSTGPHLHFETRVSGSAVNPRQYLSGSPC